MKLPKAMFERIIEALRDSAHHQAGTSQAPHLVSMEETQEWADAELIKAAGALYTTAVVVDHHQHMVRDPEALLRGPFWVSVQGVMNRHNDVVVSNLPEQDARTLCQLLNDMQGS